MGHVVKACSKGCIRNKMCIRDRGSTGCAYLLHFCGKVIVITDDMTADKRIAKKLFFRKYFFIVCLLYQVVIQDVYKRQDKGRAWRRITISGHKDA